jgi:polygalacturonase
LLKNLLAELTAFLIAVLLSLTAHTASARDVMVVGHGATYKYHSVQQAVDAVPSYNDRAITIRVAAGTYVGKVTVPATKPYITIQGAGAGRTVLTTALNGASLLPNGRYVGTFNSASVAVYASHFTARDVTFANSYGVGEQAVALQASGRDERFYGCAFTGWQDTLLLRDGPDYLSHCTIVGADDFIFGTAAAYFSRCNIHAIGPGCITAASTPTSQPVGLVFDGCKVTSTVRGPLVYLGRPWRPFASVTWTNCFLPSAINPALWERWRPAESATHTRYAVSQCTGPGWAHANPVKWSHLYTSAGTSLRQLVLQGWNPVGRQAPGCYYGRIPLPRFARRSVLVTHIAHASGAPILWTSTIQAAINQVHQDGGGRVVIPAGRFVTGPLKLRSEVDLHLDLGALLQFTGTRTAYTLTKGRYEDCLTALNCHDVAITGHGIIDGDGETWWAQYRKAGPLHLPPHLPSRPYMVLFQNCSTVLVKDVHLQNSPSFHLVPSRCNDVTITGITITSPPSAENTDGMDPSGHHFRITNCTFDEGDDCIAIKPSAKGNAANPSCSDFLIAHCTFLHGHGLSIGGQTPGGMTGLLVTKCRFNGTQAGIRLKAGRGSGGPVWNLTYRDLTMTNVRIPILITSYYPSMPRHPLQDRTQPITRTTPVWSRISIINLTATGADTSMVIVGLPEEHVASVSLENVAIAARHAAVIVNVDGLAMRACKLQVTTNP